MVFQTLYEPAHFLETKSSISRLSFLKIVLNRQQQKAFVI